MSTEEFLENSGKHATRRTIVRGAAWSVPVLAAAVSTPLAAASTNCDPESQSFTVPGSSSSAAGLHTWEVPQGVTSVEFQVYGAPGGKRDLYVGVGGAGALVTGTLAVTPGQLLELVVGQGGLGGNDPQNGGEGFGNGGASYAATPPTGNNFRPASGGGGGSAILLGGEPVVVAGGGGGSWGGGWNWTGGTNNTPRGGAADRDADDVRATGGNVSASIAGGGKSNGEGGAPSGATSGSTAGLSASGRDGADGAIGKGFASNSNNPTWVMSGGGGGGYTGGGSGSVLYYKGGSIYRFLSAGGGGGTSYVAPSSLVVGTILAGRAAATQGGIRVPGEIVLTWKPTAC